jgi:hypothetical protein
LYYAVHAIRHAAKKAAEPYEVQYVELAQKAIAAATRAAAGHMEAAAQARMLWLTLAHADETEIKREIDCEVMGP